MNRYRKEHPDAAEVKERVTVAFKALRRKGYMTRQNFLCCGGCASAQLVDMMDAKGIPETERKGVYFSRQGEEGLWTHGSVHISWSGNGQEIVDACKAAGLGVEWDGTDSNCVHVFKALPVVPVATENLNEQ